MEQKKSIEDFQRDLENISIHEGVPYKRAYLLFEEEDKHKVEVYKYKGYLALSDAFKCFYLETVELINSHIRPNIKTPLSEFYALFLAKLSIAFKSICAAERIAITGYPHNGYALLRNILDDLVLTSAALQKITDFYSLEGVVSGQPFDINSAKKLRKKTEFEVRDCMLGSKSGLKKETQEELKIWDDLFDFETHGSRLSLAASQNWLKGIAPLPVLPKFNEKDFALFINRYCEIGWMLHRLIPAIQPPNILFPDEWSSNWQIIDESFKLTVNALTEDLNKKIGNAIVELVEIKFPFNQNYTFPLN